MFHSIVAGRPRTSAEPEGHDAPMQVSPTSGLLRIATLALAACTGVGGATAATAATADALAAAAIATTVTAAATTATAPSAEAVPRVRPAPFGGAPLSAARLAGRRGGTSTSDAQFVGSVSQAQADNLTTGANTLAGGAFANSSGVATVIQNSGNNVLIQNSMIVNVQLK